MNIIEFDALIEESERGSGTLIFFPYDIEETFGAKGQVKIQCEFDGVPYRGSIVNMGSGPCIGIIKSIRQQIGKQAGDSVHVRLWKDEMPRVIEIPEDLQAAFNTMPEISKFFEGLSYTNKKEYVQWITGAKKEETRKTRVDMTIEKLKDGKKSPKA